MNWRDKFKGKGAPAARGGDNRQQGPNRGGGGTVVRLGVNPAPTIGKPGIRFKPNHDVTVDLQIKSLLGSGGMGEVYLARQRQWDVDVALKIPNDQIVSDPENRHRIIREAEAWTDLGLHPNIAYCYYAQPLGELLLLVIEYADGGNLRQWIADGRCADLKTGLGLAIQFCHGLEHAHKKLVHRDIKPENILLMQDGTLKITDFGIVRKSLADPDVLESTGAVRRIAAGMTTAGIGTADYMAPEQWGDQRGIDSRADIFAFGVCLYEMFCGARPYPITAGPRQEAPDPGRMRGKGLPEHLSRLMKRCVDWGRDRRPNSAQEVRAELRALYEEQFGEPCLQAALPELTVQADDWNNRALSYLALGRTEDAEKAWQKALEADPQHLEAIYNYGLHQWREAKATDQEVLKGVKGVADGDPTSWLPRFLLTQVHLERGDAAGAKGDLAKIQGEEAARPEVAEVRRALRNLSSPSGFVRDFRTITGLDAPACMSADGTFALSARQRWSGGRWNFSLRLWDVKTGRHLRTLRGHTGTVKSVCLSADGRFALSGGGDKKLKLWDLKTGHCLNSVECANAVNGVYLDSDGRFALSGDDGGALLLWDMRLGQCVRQFADAADRGDAADVAKLAPLAARLLDKRGMAIADWERLLTATRSYSPIACACLSSDGHLALSGCYHNLYLWDVKSGRNLRSFDGHTGSVESVCFSLDGRFALSGSGDMTLKLWNVGGGTCLRTLRGHTSGVTSACLSADGRFALSGSWDMTLRFWDVNTGRCLRTFERDSFSRIRGMGAETGCLSADGCTALSVGGGWTALLWKIGSFKYRATFRLSRLNSSAAAMSAAVRYIDALSDARGASRAGDSGRACQSLRRARQEPGYHRAAEAVREWGRLYSALRRRGLADCWLLWRTTHDKNCSASLSADGKFVLTARYQELRLWETNNGRCHSTFEKAEDFVDCVCLSADGRFAISGNQLGGLEKQLNLWDTSNGHRIRTFGNSASSICLNGDGRLALSVDGDNALKLWNVESGRCLRTLSDSGVGSISLSSDGTYALSNDGSRPILWNLTSGRRIRTFRRRLFSEEITSFTMDTRYALGIGGLKHKMLRLYDLNSGRCVRKFKGHTRCVNTVCLSADGKHALSGGDDQTLRIWDVSTGRCLRTLRHEAPVSFCGLTPDGQRAISVCENGAISAWFLDWDLEENEPADWDEGARPYLEVFLRAHRPYAARLPKDRQPTEEEVTRAFTRVGKPTWSHEDWMGLLRTLQCAGYGWLRPDGVGRELERMTAAWRDPQ